MNEQQINRRLTQRGYRITKSRSQVVAALLLSGGHISADDLYQQMKAAGSTIGRMTIFRTLDLLAEINVVRAIYQKAGAARYILLHDGHHHHVICTQCNEIVEFEECILSTVGDQIGERLNFTITGHLIELYGLCLDCQSK